MRFFIGYYDVGVRGVEIRGKYSFVGIFGVKEEERMF